MKFIKTFSITAVVALFSLTTMAQIAPQKGSYYNDKLGTGLSLNILDNNKYELVIFSGDYKQSNDTLHFNFNSDKSPFDVEFVKGNSGASTRKISFKSSSINYLTGKIYLGIPQLNDSVKYQSLTELFNIDEYSVIEDSLCSKDIDITSHIYLVYETDTAAQVLKYNIPLNIKEINVTFNPISFAKIALTGIIQPSLNQIVVTDGKQPMNFILKSSADVNSTLVKAAETTTVAQWSYPGKPQVPDYSEDYYAEGDSTYEYEYSEPAYTYVMPQFDNFKDAQASIKNQLEKILVVMFDPSATASSEAYNSFISTYQQETQSKMYEAYMPQYDRYNFYFAPSSDAKNIANFGIGIDKPTVLFLNCNGTVLYQSTDVTLNDHFFYYSPESLYAELQVVNGFALLDASLKSTTSTNDDFTNALVLVASNNSDYDYDSYSETDTVATVFYTLTVAENRYRFRGSKEQVNNKWSQILSAQIKNNTFDKNCAIVSVEEVENQGFSRSLFSDRDPLLSASDFLAITYIGKHQAEIINIVDGDSDGYAKYTNYEVSSSVVSALNSQFDVENSPSPMQIHQALNSYKEYVAATKGNSLVLNSYLDVLLKANMGSLFIDTYSAYYKDVVSDSRDIRVHLDIQYNQEPIGTDWRDFKYGFANRANNAAWYVVEHSKDLDIIKRAIVWSETSLDLEKNNVYYLDTLAQLYYLNGEYDKAIATEQSAIDLSGEAVSEESIDIMKSVLAKMKNRTY